MTEAQSEPLITGVHAAMIGVSDLAPHTNLFCDGLGWEVIQEGLIPDEICRHLWNVDSDAEVVVLTSANATSGRVHLLRFPGLDPTDPGLPALRTYGFHGLNMYVRDMAEMVDRLTYQGAHKIGEAKWSLEAQDGSSQTIHQIKMDCGEGMGIVFVNPNTPRFTHAWKNNQEAFCTELTSVVIFESDVDTARPFWGPGGLGLEFHYDNVIGNPASAALRRTEPDETNHLLFGFGKESARVELLGRGYDKYRDVPREDLAPIQRPGVSLGETGWVMIVDNVDATLKILQEKGGQVIATPMDVGTPIHGQRRVAVAQSPEGIWLNLWENDR